MAAYIRLFDAADLVTFIAVTVFDASLDLVSIYLFVLMQPVAFERLFV